MLAVIKAIWGAFVSCILFFLSPLLAITNSKHNLPFASPKRTPPDSDLFPHYLQNKQGIWLYWREWAPTNNKTPVGVVFLCGGLFEHGARYDAVAQRLNQQGFHAFYMDNQGHGNSEGDRAYVESFFDYVDDQSMFVQRMMAKYPELASLPRFLFGHSMGGLIATHFALRDPTAWQGVVLSAPALEPDPKVATPLMKSIASLLSDVFPKLGLDHLDGTLVCRNPSVVQLAQQDPLYPNEKLKARWGNEMLKAMDDVWKKTHQATFPLLLLHGKDDLICSPSGSRKFFELAKSEDKSFKEFEGMYHEILNEGNRADVYVEMFKFFSARMNRPSE